MLMSKIMYIGSGLVAILVIYQIYVSFILLRADEYEQIQRFLQLFIVWVIPLFGAIVCHVVLRSQRETVRRKDNFFVAQGPNDSGADGHYGDGH
jgi:ABC-type nickel/cobalt efflux system permease component RcnA